MMKTKKQKIITAIIVAAVVALSPMLIVFALNFVAWSGIFIGALLSPAPAVPEVKYAEFPFEIVYEIDGEIVTVNDVYVCEYAGIIMNENGKYRTWKGYVKSTGDENVLLFEDEDRWMYCGVGSPKHYMGDPVKYDGEMEPNIYDVDKEKFTLEYEYREIDDLLEEYKIKLISWKLSEPIENSFK